jgi:predicted N-formylglutamate amidohydrolase
MAGVRTTTDAGAAIPLLGAGDPSPFEVVNPDGAGRAILIADHAGRSVPRALGTLGLDEAALARHIAWDIGIGDVTRRLAKLLDSPAVLASYSRLVIDPNRRLADPTSIAEESDGVAVAGNRGLGPSQRERRAREIFEPYHAAVARLIDGRIRARLASALVSMHSFTPVLNGQERPWQVGILWNRDGRLALPLLQLFGSAGLCVGDNEPYSGRDEHGYSIYVHGQDRGLPYVLIEVRQDLIDTHHGAEAWAARLAEAIGAALAEAEAPEG